MNRLFELGLFALTLSFMPKDGFAQDWKISYDQAISAYQKEDFLVALSNAETSYSTAIDLKSKTYSTQLITASCLALQKTDKGLAFIEEEIKLFTQIEGTESKNYAEALKKQVTFLEMNNDLSMALQKVNVMIPIMEKVFGLQSIQYGLALLMQGNLLVSLGDFKSAQKTLATCLVQLKQFDETEEDYYMALFLSAVTDNKLTDFTSSDKKLKEYIAWSDKNATKNTEEYNQAKVLLSEMLLSNKDNKAEILTNECISDNQKTQYYLKVAQRYQQENKLDSALKYYTLCENLIDKAAIQNNTAFSTMINLATILINKKDLARADKKVATARIIAASLYAKNTIEYGYLYIAEASLLQLQELSQQAEERYLQAGDAIKTLPAESQVKLLMIITGRLLKASRYQSALNIIKPLANDPTIALHLSEHDLIDMINLYCTVLQSNHDNSDYEYLAKQIDSIISGEGKRALQTRLAVILIQRGDVESAGKILNEVLKVQDPKTKLYAEATYELARLQQRMGHFHDAEKNYLEAIKTYNSSSTVNEDAALSEIYNSLATFYMTLGNYDAAEHLYNDIIKQTDPNSEFYSVLRQNLATIYEQTLRYNEAKKLLEATLQHDKFMLGTSHPDYAITLQNLAVLYQKTGDLNKAKTLFTLALKIDKDNTGDQSLAYASKLANLGTVYQGLGNINQAKTYYEEALKIREAKIGKQHPDYIYNQYNLAVLYQRQKDFEHAYPLFNSVANFYLNQINELFPSLSELEKTAFYNKISEIINAYQDFGIEFRDNKRDLSGDLYNFRLATKALLLNASTKIRNHIIHSGDKVLLSRFNEWQHVKEALAKLYTLDLEEKVKQQQNIESLQRKANDLEKDLSAKSELFSNHYDKKNITWQNVMSALKPGEAAIEMIRLKVNKRDSIIYAALIVKKGIANPILVVLPHGDELESREFNNYKNSVLFQIEDKRSYSYFWLPLQSALADINTIYFSPDGIFNKINLETLYDPVANQYLIDRATIYLVSNTKEVLNQSEKLPTSPQATLLGFPDYNLEASNETQKPVNHLGDFNVLEKNSIPELPGTKEELLKISELLQQHQWNVKLYIQEQATEENIKAQHSPTILHIATHGFFIESTNDNMPIIYSNDLSKKENNPLLRSGLILAGAENHGKKEVDDGILTALEAMNLNLDKTILVILSACETGSGQIKNGEGVFGLQRSFLVSGASSIMMSLWKVNDEATQELMIEFYKNWLTSDNKADAFRKTQLVLKKKYSFPYYWGSFIMMGK